MSVCGCVYIYTPTHLGCFHILAIVNNVAMSVVVHRSFDLHSHQQCAKDCLFSTSLPTLVISCLSDNSRFNRYKIIISLWFLFALP